MSIIEDQKQLAFWDPTPDRSMPLLKPRPSDEDISMALAENNMDCPLNHLVVSEKNRKGMHMLRLLAFRAYRSHNHSCRGLNFGIYCGPGQGKTTIVKAWAETIGIPFVFIQSKALHGTWQLFEMIRAAFDKVGTPLVPQTHQFHFALPPCIVFFDEAHSLSKELRTAALLNPMEGADGWLLTSPPGKNPRNHTVDCQQACWVAATTDPGTLYAESEAFFDRLSNHIVWHSADKNDLSLIVKANYPNFPMEACRQVAFYTRIPRQAISFALLVETEREMMKSTWKEAAASVAEINGIDCYGMGYKQVDVLRALGQRPISKNNLCVPAKCRIEELETMILPGLLDDVTGRGSLIQVTSKGFAITKQGLSELNKRGIVNRGDEVSAERVGG